VGIGDKIFELAKASITLGSKVDSLTTKIDRMDDALRDVDRRLIRMETTFDIYARTAIVDRSHTKKPS
jgi:hypothetical protein